MMVKPGMIAHDVAEYFGMDVAEMVGPCRDREHIAARHVAIHLLHAAGWTHVAIGRKLNREHTTVWYWLHKELSPEDLDASADICRIRLMKWNPSSPCCPPERAVRDGSQRRTDDLENVFVEARQTDSGQIS